jgi:leader peptidase (prepilin peptidase) / N-methyltransferase
LIGSFLTVVVDRIPDGRSIVQPGSACGSCGLELGVRDLVPIFSWLVLRGRCRRCKAQIGAEVVVIELVTGVLFVLLALRYGLRWALPGVLAFAGGLVGLSVIDLHTKRLPREITYVTAALALPFLTVDAVVRDNQRRVLMMLIGAGCAFAFMALVYVASRGGMGDGDVRLSPLLGAVLGWELLAFVPVGLFLGFLLGSIVGVGMMALGKGGRKSALPFGPFLAAGSLLGLFVGRSIVDALGW